MYRCCEANGYKFSKRKKGKSNILKLLAGKYGVLEFIRREQGAFARNVESVFIA
jgi:hypothetical protein